MKTFLKIYISLCLILSPIFIINSANAATVGTWTLGGLVADGASSIVNGTKQVIIDGKDYIKKGTAKITPTASQVSKVLARGAAGYALSIAVEQLLGSVDWVLDPANNRITYYENTSDCTTLQTCNAFPQVYEFSTSQGTKYYPTLEQGCKALLTTGGHWNNYTYYSSHIVNSQIGQCNYRHKQYPDLRNMDTSYQTAKVNNPAYDPEAEREQKSIPLDHVSSQVIANANNHPDQQIKSGAQVATTAAAQDIINDAEQDETKARPIVQQLEASASTENADSAAQEAANEATGTSQPNTANPEATDIALEFPTFCGWAPVVCEAAQVVISFPTKVEIWVSDAFDLGQRIETEQKATTAEAAKTATATEAINQELTNSNDLPQKDTSTVVLPDVPIVPQTVNVNWGNSCPAPTTATLAIFGQSTEITLVNYEPICEWAWVVEYSVIALASISSVFIVAGRKS